MASPEAKEWMLAIEDEMVSFKHKGTFELVDDPGRKTTGSGGSSR